jgi:hypothetical protein
MASNRRALCAGINKFKNYPSAALQGCVNDTRDRTSVLKDFLGFTSKDITTLTDARATKVNIMKNLLPGFSAVKILPAMDPTMIRPGLSSTCK